MQDKPALVFLCQRLPYAPNKGERIQSFNMLRHLTRHYRVFLGTFLDDPSERREIDTLRAMVEGLCVVEAIKPWSFFRALPRWLAGQPISFSVFRSRKLEQWLDRIEVKHKPIAVFAHSSNISAYAVDRFRRSGVDEPRRILHFSDVDSEKFVAYAARSKGVMRYVLALEARRVRREERRLIGRADAVGFVSDDEANLFRSIASAQQDRIFTLRNGVDTTAFDPRRYPIAPFAKNGPVFMFTGAMDYLPNIEAVIWFSKHVLPAIRAAFPGAKFMIVGSNPSSRVRNLADDPAIVVTGRVESTAAYLAHADVAVAPLMIARGIQNKVLEAMAMARPVVVSNGALTGISAISGHHLISAESTADWSEHCIALIRDPARARQMGNAARRRVQEVHSWEAQFERLDRLLAPESAKALTVTEVLFTNAT
jgi:sugar transferase (PEP-CTERM/EpsH1 system associated)